MPSDPTKERRIPSLDAQDWQSPLCYGCGPDNPHSLKAHFRFDENSGEVRFAHKPLGFEHGAPGYMHGGALATILDEAQGTLCHHIGYVIMTENLNITYHKAVSMRQEFLVRCAVTAVRRRRMYTRATIHSLEGELLVSSKASWYILPDRTLQRMFRDYMDAAEVDFLRAQIEANRKRAREIRKRLAAQAKNAGAAPNTPVLD